MAFIPWHWTENCSTTVRHTPTPISHLVLNAIYRGGAKFWIHRYFSFYFRRKLTLKITKIRLKIALSCTEDTILLQHLFVAEFKKLRCYSFQTPAWTLCYNKDTKVTSLNNYHKIIPIYTILIHSFIHFQ